MKVLGWRIRPGPFGISWGVLPHVRVQQDVLGAEGDPSAGCALPDMTVTWICAPERRPDWRRATSSRGLGSIPETRQGFAGEIRSFVLGLFQGY